MQVKILSNFLTRETFGLFVSLRGFSLLIAMLAANGLPLLLLRWLPVHEARGERAGATRVTVFALLAAAVLFVGLGTLAFRYRDFFLAFAQPGELAGGFYLWFFATTAGVLVKQVVYGGLNGLRRLTVQVVIELVTLAAILVWIALVRTSLSLVVLFQILGVVHVVTATAAVVSFFRLLQGMPVAQQPAAGPGHDAKSYGSYFAGAAGLSIIALAFTDVDRYLVSQVLALELLALFHVAARITRLSNRVLSVPNLAFQPEITRVDSEGRADRITPATRIFLKFNTAISVLIALFIVLFAREIVLVVANHGYLGAVPALIIMALSLPLTTMTAPITTVMRAVDQVNMALVADLAWAVTYIVLLAVLGSVWQLTGVAVAHVTACALQLLLSVILSRLPIGPSFVLSVGARLALLGALSFWPVFVLAQLMSGAPVVVAKLLAFGLGCVAYQRLLRFAKIFNTEEKAVLTDMLGMGPVSRAVRLL